MPKPKYGIKIGWGYSRWVLDPMTDEPKEFDSNIAAIHYARLSFGPFTSKQYGKQAEWMRHTVVRLD